MQKLGPLCNQTHPKQLRTYSNNALGEKCLYKGQIPAISEQIIKWCLITREREKKPRNSRSMPYKNDKAKCALSSHISKTSTQKSSTEVQESFHLLASATRCCFLWAQGTSRRQSKYSGLNRSKLSVWEISWCFFKSQSRMLTGLLYKNY